MLLPANTRRHVLTALEATPWVVRLLIETTPEADPRWRRSEGGRFSCRDAVAHLADWDLVFTERLRQTLSGENISTEDADSDQRAVTECYSETAPGVAAELLRKRRSDLVGILAALPEEAWERHATHPRHGPMSVEAQAVHVLGHDGYHLGYLARLLSGA
jgi:uncharacterized damage-inducible protein DinB